jgi:biopolymer transport protein ExbD
MKYIHSLSHRRLTAAALIITMAGLGAIAPVQLTAQDSKSGIPESASCHWKLEWTEDSSSRSAIAVRVDDEGHYNYAGRVMELGEIMAKLKNAAASDPSASLAIQLTPHAPVGRLAGLLDELDVNGIRRVSLVTLTQGEAYCHIAPASIHANSPPQVFNIDFGVAPSKQSGPAAAGREGDFWNAVSVAWNNDHTETGLKFASGGPSPVQVRMINLGGGWGSSGRMGVKAPMLDSYNYPVDNRGGNAQVILKAVPPGMYDVYIYGHEESPSAYGDYTLTVGNHEYGRKVTSNRSDAIENTAWVDGSQYVKYSEVEIGSGNDVNILIQPGGQVTDHFGRTFSDAVICGLQLIRVR